MIYLRCKLKMAKNLENSENDYMNFAENAGRSINDPIPHPLGPVRTHRQGPSKDLSPGFDFKAGWGQTPRPPKKAKLSFQRFTKTFLPT